MSGGTEGNDSALVSMCAAVGTIFRRWRAPWPSARTSSAYAWAWAAGGISQSWPPATETSGTWRSPVFSKERIASRTDAGRELLIRKIGAENVARLEVLADQLAEAADSARAAGDAALTGLLQRFKLATLIEAIDRENGTALSDDLDDELAALVQAASKGASK